MNGTMLWFNADKGFGFIRTEHEERLFVAYSGFLPGHLPKQRCKGRSVSFERLESDEGFHAVAVAFVEDAEPRRARLRHSRSGHSL